MEYPATSSRHAVPSRAFVCEYDRECRDVVARHDMFQTADSTRVLGDAPPMVLMRDDPESGG